jgi:hypothetical protein
LIDSSFESVTITISSASNPTDSRRSVPAQSPFECSVALYQKSANESIDK